jgi:hypothetical protein
MLTQQPQHHAQTAYLQTCCAGIYSAPSYIHCGPTIDNADPLLKEFNGLLKSEQDASPEAGQRGSG